MRGFRIPDRPRDSHVLFSTLLDDALSPKSPAREFLQILNHEAFQSTFRKLEGEYNLVEGRPPFHPKYLVSLYLYGMLKGIRSSRSLEDACHNRVDVIWLMEGQKPDHATIAGFVKRHDQILLQLFKDTLEAGTAGGFIKLKHVAVDGTKIEANASKTSVKPEAEIVELQKLLELEIAKLRKQWEENEVRDRSLFVNEEGEEGGESGPTEAEIGRLKARQERTAAALESIKRRQAESSDAKGLKKLASTTDPDARHMKDKKGNVRPNFNVQIATDLEQGMIVAHEVNDLAHDSGLLLPMIQKVVENTGSAPSEVTADKAYNFGHDLAALELMGSVTFVPEQSNGRATTPEARAVVAALQSGKILSKAEWSVFPKGPKGKLGREAFIYEASTDTYRCPKGEILKPVKVHKDKQRTVVAMRQEYRPAEGTCNGCPLSEICCTKVSEGRMVTRDQFEPARENARARLQTEEGRLTYRKRSHLAETPNAVLKSEWGFVRFLRRGFRAVRIETSLLFAAYNIRIMMRASRSARLSVSGLLGPPAAPELSTA